MSDPYVGEIRMFGGTFAPNGWALCDGSLVNINDNETLFQLIGTTYGGDGQTTFGLPDLRGRVPVHMGQGAGLSPRTLGAATGTEAVTLSAAQLPIHTHTITANSANGTATTPAGMTWAATPDIAPYAAAATTAMNPGTVSSIGGNQAHNNLSPYLAVNFIIALYGVYPSQS